MICNVTLIICYDNVMLLLMLLDMFCLETNHGAQQIAGGEACGGSRTVIEQA